MSFIPGGGANIFIANGQSQGFTFTWSSSGWHVTTFFQGEPQNTGASLALTSGDTRRYNDGTFSFDFSVMIICWIVTFYIILILNDLAFLHFQFTIYFAVSDG